MPNEIMQHINIVLVATTHPGNIGATARAMKTMGVSRLRLIAPRHFPSAEASARASGADDILAAAEVYDSLQAGVKDCHLVVASSARNRHIAWPVCSPEEAAHQVLKHTRQGLDAAIVFGRESSGLSNDELECCHAMLQIPTNPGFSSLNLASAVQIICYELCKTAIADQAGDTGKAQSTVSMAQMEMFYAHLQATLIDLDYLDPHTPRHLMRRLKRLFNRAGLDENEYNILRGILAAAQARSK